MCVCFGGDPPNIGFGFPFNFPLQPTKTGPPTQEKATPPPAPPTLTPPQPPNPPPPPCSVVGKPVFPLGTTPWTRSKRRHGRRSRPAATGAPPSLVRRWGWGGGVVGVGCGLGWAGGVGVSWSEHFGGVCPVSYQGVTLTVVFL